MQVIIWRTYTQAIVDNYQITYTRWQGRLPQKGDTRNWPVDQFELELLRLQKCVPTSAVAKGKIERTNVAMEIIIDWLSEGSKAGEY